MKHTLKLGAAALALSFAGATFAADTNMKPMTPAAPGSPFAMLDVNKDGRLSRDEVSSSAELKGQFGKLDADSDTYISQMEYGKWEHAKPSMGDHPQGMAPAKPGNEGNPDRTSSSAGDKAGAEKTAPTTK